MWINFWKGHGMVIDFSLIAKHFLRNQSLFVSYVFNKISHVLYTLCSKRRENVYKMNWESLYVRKLNSFSIPVQSTSTIYMCACWLRIIGLQGRMWWFRSITKIKCVRDLPQTNLHFCCCQHRVIFVDGQLFRLSLKAQHTMAENGAVQNETSGLFQ